MPANRGLTVFGIALHDLAHLSKIPPPTASPEPEEHHETGAPDPGRTHDRAALLESKAHLATREEHARFRVRVSRSRVFIALTLLSVVMFTINIIQIAVLERIVNSVFWVAVLPAIVFVSMTLAFLLWVLPYHPTLSKTWREASISRRSAWIGNCLSILLPIILCEFVYMNRVAVPTFKKKVWSTSLPINKNLPAPSFALHQWDPTIQADFGGCVAHGPPVVDCSQNMNYGDASIGLLMSFNASTSAVNISRTSVLEITYNVSYNSSQGGYQGGVWEFIVYDSHQDTDFIQQCDPIVPMWLVAAVGRNDVYLQQTTIADDVGAVVEPKGTCTADIYPHYNQYYTSVHTLPVETGRDNQCDLGLPNYTGPCRAVLTMKFSSLIVTTLRSDHGTDWKQMLLDEGSIVGGIMFVTWFFNIFVT
ncbi:hypothetical protein B0A55_01346 [Friedmanniomyces simplex]|uniref:Uncharacterized protein n=1 Tax=Friedmanniomyces simplex TaxID=329884 RepID=A0A4U0XVA5_9PEZI|nr:hypothetical protein B0A55_01346 [Friedmanniomyces simplex]